MRAFKVPLTPDPQIFDIYMGNKHYGIKLAWNADMVLWCMDISDYNSGEPLINGIPLVTGCDLIGQYRYLGIPGRLLMYGLDSVEPPTLTNLGSEVSLYYYSDEDIAYA